jgi:nucleotide-binding universal stress UspA family protein
MSQFVLAATDGSAASAGALRLAHLLAQAKGTKVEVLGVVEPVPVFDAGFMVALPEVELYESRQEALKREIRDLLEEVTGDRDRWPVTVEAGVPGTRIVKRAEDSGADAILLGIGRHRPMDRVFGTETVLQVIRVSHIPVLAVPQDTQALPRSAAFAVDFSLFSERAAAAALAMMDTPWEAHLVHVLSGMEFLPSMSEEWRGDYEEELREKLQEFSRELQPSEADQVHHQILEGEPANELLAFAEGKGVELLAAGSHGHSFVGRLLMGSVSTRLIRGAHVPVMVVPPTELTQEVLHDSGGAEVERPWAEILDTFTRNNAGRPTTLEVDDPEAGLQQCGKNFILRGADYDPKNDRIDIMLGPEGAVEGHLTHSIPSPKEVRIERDEEGRALALEIRLDVGSFTLRVHRS